MINSFILDDYLKKTKKLLIEVPEDVDLSKRPSTAMITALANVNSLGFEVTDSLYKSLLALDTEDRTQFNEFYDTLMSSLREMKGGDHNFEPFYKNFPEETLNMSDEEFYWNAFCYYFGMAVGIPEAEVQKAIAPAKNPRMPFTEKPDEYIKIGTATMDDYKQYIKSLCESKANLGKGGEESIRIFFEHHKDVFRDVEELCPFLRSIKPQNKSNMCIKDKFVLEMDLLFPEKSYILKEDLKTPTDVLRLFVYDQTKETDLRLNPVQEVTRRWYFDDEEEVSKVGGFKTVPAAKRKAYLALLENTLNSEAAKYEMWNHANLWKKAAYRLKPGKYMAYYPKAFAMINKIRNDRKPRLDVEKNITLAFQTKNTDHIEYIFEKNPGIMLQRVEKYLEIMSDKGEFSIGLSRINKILEKNANNEINVRLIFRELAHCREMIKALEEKKETITYEGHGDSHRAYQADKIIALGVKDYERLKAVLEGALMVHMAQKDTLGKVYITPEAEALLDGIKAPMNLKNINPAIRNLSEGSRIPVSESGKELYRCFTQWHNLPGKPHSTYCDMHVVLLDEKGDYITAVGWNYSPHSIKEAFNFSGDMCAETHGYGDVVTYTDINMSAVKKGISIRVPNKNATPEELLRNREIKEQIKKLKEDRDMISKCYTTIPEIYEVARVHDVKLPAEIVPENRDSIVKAISKALTVQIKALHEERGNILNRDITPRYAVIALENWAGNMFNTVQCQCGVMLRDPEKKQEGEVFEAGSVKDTFNLSCNAQNTMSFAFDLKNEEMIWVNKPYDINGSSRMVVGDKERSACVARAFKSVLEKDYVTMRDVLYANISARGEFVSDISQADCVIGLDNMDLDKGQRFIDLYEPSLIAAEFLDCRFRPENILQFAPERQVEIITSYEGKEHYDELVNEVSVSADKIPGEREVLKSVLENQHEDLSRFTEEELSKMLTKEVKALEKEISDPDKVKEHNERIHALNGAIKDKHCPPSHTHEIDACIKNPLGNHSKAKAMDKAHDASIR